MAAKRVLRIANAGGYWGDDPSALARQISGGALDYVTLDFLAETTMSILQKQRAADPSMGYAHDFVRLVSESLPELMARKVRLVTNAGGVSPAACAEALFREASARGLKPKIAVVFGDDIVGRLEELQGEGAPFTHLDSGRNFREVASRISAANVYLGALPVAAALETGADIVITGRINDAALVLGPLVYELGWEPQEWDKLACGVAAGHLLECGAQATGGNFTDWEKVPTFRNMGFPIAEVDESGTFILTKHSGTGGLVTPETVGEQLLYEIGDPKAYVTPDVVADFSGIRLEAVGPDKVRVSGAKGSEPTDQFKVSMAYDDGFKVSGGVWVAGPNAAAKAKAYADLLWSRCADLEETRTELGGWDAFHGKLAGETPGDEIFLRLSARSADRRKLGLLGRMIPSFILSGPPGITFTGGVPKPQEVVTYWPTLVPKAKVKAKVALFDASLGDAREVDGAVSGRAPGVRPLSAEAQVALKPSRTLEESLAERRQGNAVPLRSLCRARSGDKGDNINLGVIARTPEAFSFLKGELTAQRVKDWFQELCRGRVIRYEIPGLLAFNFVLEQALGGGGLTTLRLDALGKGFGEALLRQTLLVKEER